MTREEAKNKIHDAQGIGSVYFMLGIIDEVYDDFEKDMTDAYTSIEEAIGTLEKMKNMELDKEQQ